MGMVRVTCRSATAAAVPSAIRRSGLETDQLSGECLYLLGVAARAVRGAALDCGARCGPERGPFE